MSYSPMPFSDSWYGGTAGNIATPGSCKVYRRRESLDALGSSKGPLKGLGWLRRRRDCSCSLVSNSPCDVRWCCETPKANTYILGRRVTRIKTTLALQGRSGRVRRTRCTHCQRMSQMGNHSTGCEWEEERGQQKKDCHGKGGKGKIKDRERQLAG